MSWVVISAIGPASSVQDGGRFGAQRYGLVPSGAMDRLALATTNCLVGNALFAAAIEVGPLGATFTARDGAVRVALAGAPRNPQLAPPPLAPDTPLTFAHGESLQLRFSRGGTLNYLALASGVEGEPTVGSPALHP